MEIFENHVVYIRVAESYIKAGREFWGRWEKLQSQELKLHASSGEEEEELENNT